MSARNTHFIGAKTSKILLGLFVFVVMGIFQVSHGSAHIQTVRALSAFNTDSQDYSTLRSANYTDFPDSTNNWADQTSAKAGDIVSFAVYYHNSANETAYNVRASMSVPASAGTSVTATGSLDSDNFNQAVGQSTINLSSAESLTYIPGSAKWYPNQSTTAVPFPFGQTGDEVVTAQGVNIGDVDSGWSTQGSVVARFQVSNSIVPPVDNPGTSSVDITANGSQGPLLVTNDESFTADWISQNVTDCSVTTTDNLFVTGVDANGSLGVVNSAHPFYPEANGSRTFVITCQGLSGPVTDSVVVTRTVIAPPPVQTLPDPTFAIQTGTQCGGTIDISWDSVAGATSYKIFRDGSLVTTQTGNAFTDTGLNAGQSYTYSMRAVSAQAESDGVNQSATSASQDCGGNGLSTIDITANGLQGPVVLSDNESFTVDWISSNTTNCVVTTGDNLFSTGVSSNGTLGVVNPAHPYYPAEGGSRTFTITCQGLTGSVSDFVQVTRPLVVPLPPVAPVVTAQTGSQCGGQIELSWNSVATANSYKVFRNGAEVSTTNLLSFTDTNLTPGQSYAYTVVASNGSQDSVSSNSATVVASVACGGGNQTSTIDITANGLQGPVVLSDNESFTVDWISSNTTNCVVTTGDNLFSTGVSSNGTLGVVNPAHPYYPAEGGSRTFTITCQGLTGSVSDSVVVSRPVTPKAPVAPVISAINSTCSGQVTLSWNSVATATSYKVFRNGAQIATATTTTFIDSNLAANTLYTYAVKATNAVGDSPLSGSAATTVPDTCVTVPTAPVVFAMTGSQCGGSTFVSWNAVSNATSYNVFRNGNLVASSSNLSFTDTNLTPGQSYAYTVVAINTAGTSPSSNVANATASAACILPPQAPVLVANTGTQCGGNVVLSWNTVSGSDSYVIYRDGNAVATTTSNSYTNTGLIPGQSYTFTVKGHNSAGYSVASNVKIVKSSAECPLPTPTVTLVANPSTITQGQNSTLTWTSQNASSCSAVWTSATLTTGSQVVSPNSTTTYTITCTNGQTTATATATVTVNALPPVCEVPTITSSLTANGKVGDAFSYTISASSTSTSTIAYSVENMPEGWTLSGNTISGTPTQSGTFTITLKATNTCGTDSKNLVVTIAPAGGGGGTPDIIVTLVANPNTINLGATSTLTWTSTNATSCSAAWTTATTTSGSQIVSPATTTAYTINCANATKSGTATATVTVVPPTQCVLPAFTSPLTVNGKVGDAFSYTFTANTQGTSTIFRIATSTLPAGLSLTGNTISGIPTTAGTFTVPVSLTNDCGSLFDYTLVITIAPAGGGGGDPTIGVTLTANPSTVNPGGSSTLSWTSTNATSCSAAWTTATTTSGSLVVTVNDTTNYSINCSNGSLSATSTATVTVVPASTGGGGSSSGGSRSGGRRSVPTVLSVASSCDYLRDYLHIGWNNDPVEMIKLQVFLRELAGFKNLQITNVFDQATFDAVSAFQVSFQPDILTPWGYAQGESTGYVYILTKKKINEIVCQRAYPLNSQQEEEIAQFNAFMESLRSQGVSVPGVTEPINPDLGGTSTGSAIATIDDLLNSLGENNTANSGSQNSGGLFGNANLRYVAGAIFAGPKGFADTMQAIAVVIATLALVWGIGEAVMRSQYDRMIITPSQARVRRIFYAIIGFIVAVIAGFLFKYYAVILPFLALIILSALVLLWTSIFGVTESSTDVPQLPSAHTESVVKPESMDEIVIKGEDAPIEYFEE